MLVICQTGIRIHKFDLKETVESNFPKLVFEFDWNGIASFEIQVTNQIYNMTHNIYSE